MKSSKLIKVIQSAVRNGRSLLIKGSPGVGKTDTIVQAVDDMEGYELKVRHPVSMEPIDFRGMPCLFRDDDDKSKSYAEFVPYGDLQYMLNPPCKTVFFYDDLGQSSQSVQKGMMQIMWQREINGKPISDDISFISATNRRGDRAGVGGLITPLIGRQSSILSFDVDKDDWIKWAHENKMPPILIAFIHFRGEEFLLDFDPNAQSEDGDDLVNQPNPRNVAEVGNWMNDGFSVQNDMEIFEGAIGTSFSLEFAGFIKLYDQLGQKPNNIAKGKEESCPEDPASIYALSSALASRAGNKDEWGNIAAWCESTLPDEFKQVLLLDAEMMHKKAVTETPEYVMMATNLRKK